MRPGIRSAVGLIVLATGFAVPSTWAQGAEPPPDADRPERGPAPPPFPGGGPERPFGGPGGPPGQRPEGPFPPGGPGRGFGMPQPPALSEEQADKAMRWLKENDPDRAEKLARLREERPEMHAHVLRESWEQMNHLSRLKEHDPAEYERMMKQQKLERAAGALAEKIRRSEAEEEREKLTAQLREHLASLFDMRETGREREVKEMERRLADLRKVLAERQSRKAEIIERRVGQMIGRGDALEW